jgi:outer membrane lipoprotein carrier protein
MKLFATFLLTCSALLAGAFDFETISSEFKQTITNEENSKIVYTGSFYASTKAKALWIYKSPIDKKIYFSKNQVVIVEPELEQVIITNLQNTPNLTEILKSAKSVDDNTFETTYDDTKYVIDVKNEKIERISYSDKLENKVTIELFNQSINTFLDDSLFKATIPDGFDVVTQ